MGLFSALRRLTAHDRRISDAEETVRQLGRRLDAVELEGAELRDQARRMLNRANAQRRWIQEREGPDGTVPINGGAVTADELNALIRRGEVPRL